MTRPSRSEARGYLAAILDGEGSVRVRRSGSEGSHCLTVCTNTEWSIIEWVGVCLDVLGISYHVRSKSKSRRPEHRHWKKGWDVQIWKRCDIERFSSMIPLHSAAKRAKLQAIVSSPKKRPTPTKGVLVQLYCDQHLSISQVMGRLGYKSSAAVWYWLRKYAIPIRSVSEATTDSWRRGLRGQHAVH